MDPNPEERFSGFFAMYLKYTAEDWADWDRHFEEAEAAAKEYKRASDAFTEEQRQLLKLRRKVTGELSMLRLSRTAWALEGLMQILALVEL